MISQTRRTSTTMSTVSLDLRSNSSEISRILCSPHSIIPNLSMLRVSRNPPPRTHADTDPNRICRHWWRYPTPWLAACSYQQSTRCTLRYPSRNHPGKPESTSTRIPFLGTRKLTRIPTPAPEQGPRTLHSEPNECRQLGHLLRVRIYLFIHVITSIDTHTNTVTYSRPTLMGANSGGNIADAGWQVRVIETILNNTFQIFDDD